MNTLAAATSVHGLSTGIVIAYLVGVISGFIIHGRINR